MPAYAARTALAILLIAPAAWAQTTAPTPPAPPARPHAPPGPAAARPGAPAAPKPDAPARTSAPRTSAAQHPPNQATPVVRPRSAATHRPAATAQPPAAAVPAPVPAEPAEPAKGSNTGLALPRFATLKSNEVNFRIGPGTRYPIEWVYKRADLPVQIEREFETWRLVRDQEGVKGWVQQTMLAPRRTATVTAGTGAGAEQVLRRDAKDDAGPVARLKPGVIVRLRQCDANSAWCQAQVGDYRGWIKRADLWGVSADEVIQ